jgi:hypothetical protein
MRWLSSAVLLTILSAPATAAPPATPADPPSAAELATIMRTLLKSALPTPLVAKDYNWGRQKEVWNGIEWEKDGILLKPRNQKKLKNDGIWRRIRVEAVDPDKNLTLIVKNVRQPEKGKVTFDMIVALPTKITFHQQAWVRGTRLYSGETRARCRPILALKCESTTRVEKSGGFLPDVVFRMRVLDAKLGYDEFKVEHTAGVGGDAAKVIGDGLLDTIKTLQPNLEKDLMEKAQKAIIKAGDTKEVKLGLGKLFDGK